LKIYENAYPDCYEELKTFYPVWYREIPEMDAIWRAFGAQLNEVRTGIITAVNNCFVWTADEETLGKFEEFLGIVYDGYRTLKQRRSAVSAYFLRRGHIGEQEIKEFVRLFTNSRCTVEFANSNVKVTVFFQRGDEAVPAECRAFLLKEIPAHLGLETVTDLDSADTQSAQYHANTLGVHQTIILR
jgi:hypothetical protein